MYNEGLWPLLWNSKHGWEQRKWCLWQCEWEKELGANFLGGGARAAFSIIIFNFWVVLLVFFSDAQLKILNRIHLRHVMRISQFRLTFVWLVNTNGVCRNFYSTCAQKKRKLCELKAIYEIGYSWAQSNLNCPKITWAIFWHSICTLPPPPPLLPSLRKFGMVAASRGGCQLQQGHIVV